MNALVSMHGIWLLVFVPIAAVIAWRCCSPQLRKVSLWLLILLSLMFGCWFGFLTVSGTEFTESIYDRVMHSLGTTIGAINFPILQLIASAVVVVVWPTNWEYRRNAKVQSSDG